MGVSSSSHWIERESTYVADTHVRSAGRDTCHVVQTLGVVEDDRFKWFQHRPFAVNTAVFSRKSAHPPSMLDRFTSVMEVKAWPSRCIPQGRGGLVCPAAQYS